MRWFPGMLLVLVVGCDGGVSDDSDGAVVDMAAVGPGGDAAEDGAADAGPAGSDVGLADGAAPGEDGGGPVEVEPCISTVTVGGVEIFAYEASRPDATAADAGEADGICSRAGVLPWTGVTWGDASRICMTHGFRLCSDEAWQTACQGPDRLWAFPYGTAHRPAVCNEHVSGSGMTEPTGSRPECRTPEGVYDLSGNVWEMTMGGGRRGASWKLNAVMFGVDSAKCDVVYDIFDDFADDDVGFRCCR